MFLKNSFLIQFFVIIFLTIITIKLLNAYNFIAFIGLTALVLWISWLLTELFRKRFMKKSFINTSGKVVLITGCDSGFGLLIARALHKTGIKVVATCLDIRGTSAQELNSLQIKTLELNVTNGQQIIDTRLAVEEYLKETKCQFWALINNAGVFTNGMTEWGSIDELKNMLNVNVVGLVEMTRHFLPLIRKSRGRVISMGSCAGRYTMPSVGFYSMSKHAVISFSDALRREMFEWKVKVITIEPEIYKTPMAGEERLCNSLDELWQRSTKEVISDFGHNYFNFYKKMMVRFAQMGSHSNTHVVVDAVLDATLNTCPNIRYTCCGLSGSIMWWFLELFPNRFLDIFFRLYSLLTVRPRALDST